MGGDHRLPSSFPYTLFHRRKRLGQFSQYGNLLNMCTETANYIGQGDACIGMNFTNWYLHVIKNFSKVPFLPVRKISSRKV
jgi:hypothetical protein